MNRFLLKFKKLLFGLCALGLATSPGFLLAGVNPDGSYSYSLPIAMPAGTGGVMPNLSLQYNSGGGNGMLGMGFNLSGLPVITRINYGSGINFNGNDTYAGPAGRLIDVSGNKTKYHAAKQNWGEYVPYGNCGGSACYWILYDNGGNRLYFGTTADSRIEKVGSSAVRVWALSKMQDPSGNYYTVSYSEDRTNGDFYPTNITYTRGNGQSTFRTIDFSYESRSDIGVDKHSGLSVIMDRRLKWITVKSGSSLVRKYRMDYDYGPSTARSRLKAVQEYGRNGSSTLPAVRFSWQGSMGVNNWSWSGHNTGYSGWQLVNNLFGDGRTVYYTRNGATHYATQLNEDGSVRNWSWAGHNTGSNGWRIAKNLFGDGRAVYYTRSGATHFATRLNADGSVRNWSWQGHNTGSNGWQLVDNLFGDGRTVYYTRTGATHFATRLNDDGTVQNWSWQGHNTGSNGTRMAYNLFGDGRTVYYTRNGPTHYATRLNDDGTVNNWSWAGHNTGSNGWQLVNNLFGDGRTVYHTRTGGTHFATRLNDDGTVQNWSWAGHSTGSNGTRFANNLFGDGRTVYYTRSGATHFATRLNDDGTVRNWSWQGHNTGRDGWQLVDNLFGDGRTIYHTRSGATHYVTRLNANGTVQNWSWSAHSTGSNGWQLANNFFGQGQTVYWTRSGPTHYMSRFGKPAPDLMTSVNNGLGGLNNVTYTSAAQASGAIITTGSYTGHSDGAVRQLVTATTVQDGRGAAYTTRYEYRNGRVHSGKMKEQANLGFQWIKKTDAQSGNYTITYYRQDRPFQGLVTTTASYAGGKLVSRVVNGTPTQFACNNGGCWADNNPDTTHPTQIRTANTIKYSYHNGSYLYKIVQENLAYDDYGNATRARQYAANKNGQTSNFVYDNRSFINKLSGPRALGLVYETKSCVDSGCGTVGKWERKYYDGQGLGSVGSRVLVTGKSKWAGGSVWATTNNTYDTYGNVVTSRAPNGLTTTFTYDSVFHRDRASVRTAAGTTAYTTVDPRYNVITSAVDANGLRAETTLDVFGRSSQKVKKDQSGKLLAKTTFALGMGAPASDGLYIKECRYSGASYTVSHCTYKFSDGMSRVYKVRGPAENGQQETLTQFDSRGRAYRTSKTYATGSAPAYWTTRYYDSAGRVTRIKHPDGGNSYVSYMDSSLYTGSVDIRTITDPKGRKTREYLDPAGRVVRITQAADTAQAASIAYSYDAIGRVTRVTGPTGIAVNTSYDAVGRKTSITDPNTGTTSYTYYNTPGVASFGKVKTETRSSPGTSSGTVTRTNTYDTLGRLANQTSTDGSRVSFGYGQTTYAYGLGRKTSSVYDNGDYTISNRFAYDIQGNMTGSYKTIQGPEINTTVHYGKTVDELGRAKTMTYPDGSVLNMTYNSMGRIASQTMNGVNYTEFNNYNLEGKVGRVTFANGVSTEYGYEADTGYLRTLETERAGAMLLDYTYSFDAAGNVASITDARNGQMSMEYEYDQLHRLTSASRSDGKTFAYNFDLAGNLINKAGLNTAGQVVQRTQTYQSGTHRLLNDGAGNTLTYSVAGNRLTKGPWTYTYDDANRLKTVKKQGAKALDVFYEHNGSRFLKIHTKPDGSRYKTYYLGGGYEIREKWSPSGALQASQSTLYITGVDGQKAASITSGQSLNAYSAANYARHQYALAGMGGESIAGLTHQAYHLISGFITSQSTGNRVALAVMALVFALLLAVYFRYLLAPAWFVKSERDAPTDFVRSHNVLAHVSLVLVLMIFGSFGCRDAGNDGAPLAFSVTTENGMTYGGKDAALTGDTSMGLPLGTYFYHQNHLSSAALVTDAAGNEISRINYLPYGEIDHSNSPGEDTVTFKFTGQEHDPESGLYYYNTRYYDASLGVFTSADTIVPDGKSSQAYNRYMYVAGNPVKYTDPTGHGWFKKVFKAVVKLVVAVVCVIFPVVALIVAAYYAYQGWKAGGWKGLLAGVVSGVLNAYGIPVSVSYSHAGGWGVGVSYGFSNGVGVGVGWTQNGGFNAGVSYGKKVPGLGMTTASAGVGWSEAGGYSTDVDVHNQTWDALTPGGLGATLGTAAVQGLGPMGGQTNGATDSNGGFGKDGKVGNTSIKSVDSQAGRFKIITLADGTKIGAITGFTGDKNKGFMGDVMDYIKAAHGNFSGYDDTYKAAREFMQQNPKAMVVSHSLGSWTTGIYMSTGAGKFDSPIVGMAPPMGTPLNMFSSVVAHRDDIVVYGAPGSLSDKLNYMRQLESARGTNGVLQRDQGGHSGTNLLDNYLLMNP